jgi:HlyD family secretion protein
MKRFFFWMIVVGIVVGAGAAGYSRLHGSKGTAGVSPYRTMSVRHGEIKAVVNSSGTVQPVKSVKIGAFVSGPLKVYVDFNDKVKEGQVLAEVEPLIPLAQRNQAKAALACAKANLLQAQAKLEQTKRDWKRAEDLLLQKAISDTDYDTAKAAFETAKANVAVAEATIEQNDAALAVAESNLKYTVIHSPVDGIITDRKVDSGQTVASQFQTPELFVVAPDLEKRVYVLASVDEADIGMIRDAQLRKEPVTFVVDAYPKDTFKGKIAQIRLTPTTVQNIVTYTVVVEAPNAELKLLPGMTANLSFQVEKHKDVLKIPNAALRFNPKPNQVRACDLPILEGTSPDNKDNKNADSSKDTGDDDDRAQQERNRKQRYVWIEDDAEGGLLSAVKITIGVSDKSSTELISGDLTAGQMVVTGMQTH